MSFETVTFPTGIKVVVDYTTQTMTLTNIDRYWVNQVLSLLETQASEEEVGECCFCGGECNPSSQSCGRCARDLTMRAVGWK